MTPSLEPSGQPDGLPDVQPGAQQRDQYFVIKRVFEKAIHPIFHDSSSENIKLNGLLLIGGLGKRRVVLRFRKTRPRRGIVLSGNQRFRNYRFYASNSPNVAASMGPVPERGNRPNDGFAKSTAALAF
jgi:hypothetical protein